MDDELLQLLEDAEETVAEEVSAVLAEVAGEFAQQLADATELVAARFSVSRIARMFTDRMPRIVRRLLRVSEQAADHTAQATDSELPPEWEDLPGRYDDDRDLPPAMSEYVDVTQHLLRAVGDRLADVAREELAAGVDAGEDMEQLRARLREAFAREGAQLGEMREERIARTEAGRAWNTATLGAARDVTGSPAPIVKQWLSRGDDRVRHDHADTNGQIRFLDEPFQVGDVKMDAPHDPTAPASQVVNCRCVLAVHPETTAAASDSQVAPSAPLEKPRETSMSSSALAPSRRTVLAQALGLSAFAQRAETRRTRATVPTSLHSSLTFHGTPGRPSYRKYHPSGRNSRGGGLTQHPNGGLLGSNRYSAEEHSEVLHAYTLAAYDDMNRHLRFGADPADVTKDEVRRQVSVLADLINAQESTASEKTLYRGMRNHVMDLSEGDVFHDKGFVSSSSSEKVATRAVGKKGGTFFRIKVPPGAQMLDVASVGESDDEAENILPPGTQYRVTGVGRLDDPARPAVLYDLEVINV